MYPYAASGLEGEGGFGLNEERPVGPVGKLLDFKSKTAGNRIKNLFNQPTSTKLSPTRRSIDETALLKNFNFCVKWVDGWENHKFLLDNYNSGPAAPYHSWVLLEQPAAE